MKKILSGAVIALSWMGWSAAPALAHHSFSMFDMKSETTLTGTVVRFDWTNPHTFIWLASTTGPNGANSSGLNHGRWNWAPPRAYACRWVGTIARTTGSASARHDGATSGSMPRNAPEAMWCSRAPRESPPKAIFNRLRMWRPTSAAPGATDGWRW